MFMCKAKTAKPNIGLIPKLNLLNPWAFLVGKSTKHFVFEYDIRNAWHKHFPG